MTHSKERKFSNQGLEGQLDWIQAQLQANATPRAKSKHQAPSLKVEKENHLKTQNAYKPRDNLHHPLLEVNLEDTRYSKLQSNDQTELNEVNYSQYNDTQVLLAKVDAALKGSEYQYVTTVPQEEEVNALLRKVDEVLSEPFTMIGGLPVAPSKPQPQADVFSVRNQQLRANPSKTTKRYNPSHLPHNLQEMSINSDEDYNFKELDRRNKPITRHEKHILPTSQLFRPTYQQPPNSNDVGGSNGRNNAHQYKSPQCSSQDQKHPTLGVDPPVFTQADQQRLRRLREMRNHR
ncbi:hypothetical protein K7432_000099 [Basidiobolus ranarum]|uniref:Uncharacterized protein n=1 Tax=Basidiobolus ranarum TaxID=34480 RepID=A0ABR2X501_9FUNG